MLLVYAKSKFYLQYNNKSKYYSLVGFGCGFAVAMGIGRLGCCGNECVIGLAGGITTNI